MTGLETIQATSDQVASCMKRARELSGRGEYRRSARQWGRILEMGVDDWRIYNNLGVALRQAGDLPLAIAAYRQGLHRDPANGHLWSNLANAYVDAAQLEEGLACHERALQLCPQSAEFRHNRALGLMEAARFDEAARELDALAHEKPHDARLLWDRSIALLQIGDYTRGFPGYEMRWHQPGMRCILEGDAPIWKGESIADKHLLLHAEQGFGDTIQAARFIASVRPLCRILSVLAPADLAPLIAPLPGVDHYHSATQSLPPYDVACPFMSLPGLLGTTLGTLPSKPYLQVPDEKRDWAAQLVEDGTPGLRVGIVWSGSATFRNNHRRATTLQAFLELLRVPGIRLYSLQKGPQAGALKKAGVAPLVRDLGGHLEDFGDTAAVLEKLDLVIMTDSAVAHLAGALGCPVWVLLAKRPDWRWLADREDSPWYPSMRLFRQDRVGDWDDVFDRVCDRLGELVELRGGAR